jgi:4-hydroxy-tetrahydrodipicolinate synthase
MTRFQERLHGVIPALLTPLTADLTADGPAMRRLARRVLDAGCHGYVLLGTTGEFAAIDDDQRAVAIRAGVKESDGEVPVIVGCGQPCVARTHRQAVQAADLGADGLLVNPPFYFPMSNDEVVRYFEDLVAASPIPVLLYNIPGMTKVAVDAATLLRLRDVGVQGTKDSSGSPQNLLDYLDAMRGEAFRVIVGGDGMLLHALNSGAAGTTGPAPNVAPQLVTSIYNAWCDGDLEAAAAAQNRQNAFLRELSGSSPFMQATAKGVLSRLGIMEPWVAPPKTSLDDAAIDEAFQAVREFLPEYEPAAVGV